LVCRLFLSQALTPTEAGGGKVCDYMAVNIAG